MYDITITMTTEEAEAIGFALYYASKEINEVIQGNFDHPVEETNETPDERLNSLIAFKKARDAMNVFRECLEAAKKAHNGQTL